MTEHQFPTDVLPMGAIVTASGTGAEMNGGAVITNEEKVISGAFDTLSHAMETYFGSSDGDNVSDDVALAVMRNTVVNMKRLMGNIDDIQARSNLLWDSTLSENRLIKLGKKCDFSCHLMEHQLGVYTDCGHGQGMAVLHPAYYRHIFRDGLDKFARFASHVWMIPSEKKSREELAAAGIDALEAFIREIGLPTSLRQLGIRDKKQLPAIAGSCHFSPGGYRKMMPEEILEIFQECF